jgi:AAHS family benzoate transporter-like MFS transporter
MSTAGPERPTKTTIIISKWFEASRFNSFHLTVFLACLILNTMEGYDLFVYGAAIPMIMDALSISATHAGAIASAASLGTLIGALILGPMADRVGRKRIILGTVVLSCASMAAAGLSRDFTSFAIARLIFGVANGGMVVNIMALVSEYVPGRSRATLVGIIAAGSSIGSVLGTVFGIWAFPRYGWRPVFFVASFLIVLFPLYKRWLPEGTSYLARNNRLDELKTYLRKARPSETLADDANLEVDKGKNKVPLKEVFQEHRGMGTLLLWTCYLVNLYVIHGFSFWLPKLMMNRGFSLTKGLTFLLPLSLASIIMTFFIGRITDRVGAKPVLAVLYLLSCASIAMIGFTHNYVLLMFLVGLAGVGFNGAQNMINGYSPTYYPPSMRSTATGYNFVLGRVGGIVGPTVIGLLISAGFSVQFTMTALAMPSVIAAISILKIPEQYARNSYDRIGEAAQQRGCKNPVSGSTPAGIRFLIWIGENMKLEVFIPTGSSRDSNKFPYARRLPDLKSKTIGEISNRLWEADRVFPAIREALKQRFPDIKFVPYTEFPSHADDIQDNEELADLVLAKGCDAIIGSSAG